MMQRILVVDDDEDTLLLLSRILLEYEVVTAISGLEALAHVDDIKPDLIILDVMMPGIDGFEVCRRLRRKPTTARLPILLLTAQGTPESVVKGFEAGADQYANKPFSPVELKARVHNLLQRSNVALLEAAKPVSKVISVFSLRGGVGVSTLATNLATGLAKIWGRPTVLIDLVLTAGHAALMLGLSQNRSWANLADVPLEDIDAKMVDDVLVHHSSGLQVLSAPRRPEQGGLITADKVSHVVNLLNNRYQYIVVDLPHDFHDTTLVGLDLAQEVILMMAPELASLLSTVAALEAFEAISYPPEKVRVVLNRIFELNNLDCESMERAIKRPIDLEIPFAPGLFIPSIGKGVPALLGAPNTSISGLLEDYAFALSKEEHKRQRPTKPSGTWERVIQRMQKRQMTWKLPQSSGGTTWLSRILKELAETA